MSQSIVLERVQQKCLGIDGIARVHPNGRPFPEDEPVFTPCTVLDVIDSSPETAVLAGNKWHNYQIMLTTYLGPPDMLPAEAGALALPLMDALLTAFDADPFLLSAGGAATCFNSDLSAATRNLDTYQGVGECPKLYVRLSVTEYL